MKAYLLTLHKVPSSSALQDHCRCQRNCFQCPQCWQQLLITAIEEEFSASADVEPLASKVSVSATTNNQQEQQQKQQHIMYCPHCRWDSLSQLGWSFDKPIGLSSAYLRSLERETCVGSHGALVRQQWEFINRRSTLGTVVSGKKRMSGNLMSPSPLVVAQLPVQTDNTTEEELLRKFMHINSIQQAGNFMHSPSIFFEKKTI